MHPEQEGQVLVLLDTEGLGDIEKIDHRNQDNRLFTIAVLLTSTLVYNIRNAFDQNALDTISFITEMSKNLKLTASGEDGDILFDSIFPVFVLCIRDFYLNLYGTPTEYLEDSCLKLHPGTDQYSEDYNKPRILLRKYFKVRRCFTFGRPGKTKDLNRLEELADTDLKPKFVKDTEQFTSYVYTCSPKMLLDGTMVNGRMFASLAKSYIGAMRDGSVPCVKDAMVEMVEAENERIVEATLAVFSKQMMSIELPISDKGQLHMQYRTYRSKAVEILGAQLIGDNGDMFSLEATKMMSAQWQELRQKNGEMLMKHHLDTLEKMYQDVSDRIKKGEYKRIGGYASYRADVGKIHDQYMENKTLEKYEAERALKQFKDRKKDDDQNIMDEDQRLSSNDTNVQEQLLQQLKEQATLEEARLNELERAGQEMDVEENEDERMARDTLTKQREKRKGKSYEALLIKSETIIQLKEEEYQRMIKEGVTNLEKLKIENDKARELLKKEKSRSCTIS